MSVMLSWPRNWNTFSYTEKIFFTNSVQLLENAKKKTVFFDNAHKAVYDHNQLTTCFTEDKKV